MHRNIVLFRDSISSTTKECIFLVGNPCTLYLGLLFFWHLRPSISPDFVILQYHIEIKKHLSEHLLVKPAMAGHWRQAFWSGFFEEPDFRPFVSKVETLQKEASDAWGAYVIVGDTVGDSKHSIGEKVICGTTRHRKEWATTCSELFQDPM